MTCSRVQLIQETAGPRTLRDRSRTAEFLVGPPPYAQYHPPHWGRAQKRQTPQGARRKASRSAPQPRMEAWLTPHRTAPLPQPFTPEAEPPGCPSIVTWPLALVWLSTPSAQTPRLRGSHPVRSRASCGAGVFCQGFPELSVESQGTPCL